MAETFQLNVVNDIINFQQNEINFQKYEKGSKLREIFFGYAGIEPFGMEKVFIDTTIALLAMIEFSH